MQRRTFLKSAGMAGSLLAVAPLSCTFAGTGNEDFPLLDLHVHLTKTFTIENLMEISKNTGVRFGIVENPETYTGIL